MARLFIHELPVQSTQKASSEPGALIGLLIGRHSTLAQVGPDIAQSRPIVRLAVALKQAG